MAGQAQRSSSQGELEDEGSPPGHPDNMYAARPAPVCGDVSSSKHQATKITDPESKEEEKTMEAPKDVQMVATPITPSDRESSRGSHNWRYATIAIGLVGAAVGGYLAYLYFRSYHSPSALLETNQSLKQQLNALRFERDNFKTELNVYKAVDLKQRDGEIRALHDLNAKTSQQVNAYKTKVEDLKTALDSKESQIRTLQNKYNEATKPFWNFWTLSLVFGAPVILMHDVAADGNHADRDKARNFQAIFYLIAISMWLYRTWRAAKQN
eukprot:CAMPEP_0197057156 /NCGR_PEP_ID=MMETSP1384-20130603/93650_1 /TAXON_ID=29189 /ORGANISM="Ammonia sp." /LENGTH=267 /DNA_ID=CAMNT_0042491455 /DNA_START=114 /DNA_END=917 /DNA_ORIENTATION=-